MLNSPDNRREYFRLPYPEELMPILTIGGQQYLVTEISEAGLRLRCERPDEFQLGEKVEGAVTFAEGEEVTITGQFLRSCENEFVISPLKGVTFRRVVSEQRMILMRYPSLRFLLK